MGEMAEYAMDKVGRRLGAIESARVSADLRDIDARRESRELLEERFHAEDQAELDDGGVSDSDRPATGRSGRRLAASAGENRAYRGPGSAAICRSMDGAAQLVEPVHFVDQQCLNRCSMSARITMADSGSPIPL